MKCRIVSVGRLVTGMLDRVLCRFGTESSGSIQKYRDLGAGVMNPKELEKRMRDREVFASLRIIPGAWTIVRLDGRSFSQFTAGRYEKPFDRHLRDHMTAAARALMKQMNGLFACTHSDEISVLFSQKWDFFGRRVEKIVSVTAGLASAAFTKACSEAAHFDSRVWQAASVEEVIEYFKWRQVDSARCALHGWCYWSLRKEGMDATEATEALKGAKKGGLNELLFRRGINFNDLPAWQRRGVGLYWETCEKSGYDPVKGAAVTAARRRLKVDRFHSAGCDCLYRAPSGVRTADPIAPHTQHHPDPGIPPGCLKIPAEADCRPERIVQGPF